MKCYFVTGATGVVGSAIVPRLLTQSATEVVVLLRAKDQEELQKRLGGLMHFWDIKEGSTMGKRVTVLRGDITQERFGLNPSDYGQLIARCTHIIHAAADVHMNRSLEEARRTAVGSARQLVALTQAGLSHGTLQKVEFLSTVGVGGKLRRVPEEWLECDREFHNSYEQSKAEAEVYLRDQIFAHGLPITVHRPSMVVGDSQTGKVIHYQIFYHLCEFLSGIQTAGLVPRISHTQLDTIPVDYVAQAVIWSSQQSATTGQILHICSGPELSMTVEGLTLRLRDIWGAKGPAPVKLRMLPMWLFRSIVPLFKLAIPRRQRSSVTRLELFLNYAMDRQVFENNATRALLSQAGIVLPPPEDYFDIVLDNYLGNKKKRSS